MNGGLNSINGSQLSKIDWMFWPFNGGRISNEKSGFPLAFCMCSVTFICSGSGYKVQEFVNPVNLSFSFKFHLCVHRLAKS